MIRSISREFILSSGDYIQLSVTKSVTMTIFLSTIRDRCQIKLQIYVAYGISWRDRWKECSQKQRRQSM